MKTRFYLIRHGETDWNKDGRYQGWTDIPLSEDGREQAALLGERFRHLPLDAVYASPLLRAVETAEPVAKAWGLSVVPDAHFKEIHFGEWEGLRIPELLEKYGDPYRNFFNDPFSHPFPGEGSMEKVAERSSAGFERLLQKHKGERVAIVSHGGLLRVMLMSILDLDHSFYRKSWLTNTSITTVDVAENGNRLLMTLNDRAHLEVRKEAGGGPWLQSL